MNKCPLCGRYYSAPPAMSRRTGDDICPVCGAVEAINIPGIGDEQKKEIIAEIERKEIEAGRVEPLA